MEAKGKEWWSPFFLLLPIVAMRDYLFFRPRSATGRRDATKTK